MVRAVPQALWAFGLLISFSFLYASDKAYRATVSKLLLQVANIGIGGTRITPGAHPFSFLKGWDETIKKYIRNGMVAAERGMVTAFIKASEPFLLIVGSALAIALVLHELAKYVAHQAIHAVTRVEVHKITHTVTQIGKGAASITKAQFNHLTARVARLEHRATHIAKATAGTIANPFPRIKTVERDLSGLRKRVKSLEKLLAAGVGVGLLIKALTKLGVNYIRCDRNKQLGKGVCNTSSDWVTEFLAGAILLQGSFGFHDFVKEAQAGFDLGLEGLQLFIREFKDLDIPKS
jgi:hypothetical protein